MTLMLGLLTATPALGQASAAPPLPNSKEAAITPIGESELARQTGELPPEASAPLPEEYEQLPEGGGLLQAGAGLAPAEATGRPKYRLDAATYFDRFGVARYAAWVKARISVIKGYPPFSDKYVGLFGLPLIGYHDPATEGQAPLGRTGIEAYVARVRRDMNLGYAGVFVDDANWSVGFPPSPGPRAALANLLAAIRAAEPTALIEMNSQYHDIWPLIKSHDPDVERALKVVNILTKEFGVGPTAGINTAQDYGELFQFIDALHAKGIHVTMTGDRYSNTVSTMEYNLATSLLATDGGDFVNGVNRSGLNGGRSGAGMFGPALTKTLNDNITRQFRVGFLIEQTPDPGNRVTLSKYTDGLGLRRPEISYSLSPYSRRGIVAARQMTDLLFQKLGAKEFTNVGKNDPTLFEERINGKSVTLNYGGAGHIMGTYRMGSDPTQSVVDSFQRSHDHDLRHLDRIVFHRGSHCGPVRHRKPFGIVAEQPYAGNLLHRRFCRLRQCDRREQRGQQRIERSARHPRQ